MRIVAHVPDLMDRSRLPPGVVLVEAPADLADAVTDAGADLVLVDLSRPGVLEGLVGVTVPVMGFAPHVDDAVLADAAAAGIEALPRSRFFTRIRTLTGDPTAT